MDHRDRAPGRVLVRHPSIEAAVAELAGALNSVARGATGSLDRLLSPRGGMKELVMNDGLGDLTRIPDSVGVRVGLARVGDVDTVVRGVENPVRVAVGSGRSGGRRAAQSHEGQDQASLETAPFHVDRMIWCTLDL